MSFGQATDEKAQGAPTMAEAQQEPLSILVVEDHVASAESWDILLGLWGYPRRIAMTGSEALARCREQLPDVMMLDLRLPDTCGWEIAKTIRKECPNKRPLLIVVSAHGEPSDLRTSEEIGIDLHLVKPVNPEDLAVILRRFARLLNRPDPNPV